MDNLSDREAVAFNLLKSLGKATRTDIMEACWRNDIIITSRHSLTVMMKYLTAKVAPEGYIIAATGRRGPGVETVYTMEKKF